MPSNTTDRLQRPTRNVDRNSTQYNARYWLITLPYMDWNPPTSLPSTISWLKGQQEIGESTNYHHWQLIVGYNRAVKIGTVKKTFGSTAHAEPSRSDAADQYVWKESTAVPNTKFELGTKPIRRNNALDWQRVWDSAVSGDINSIPVDVRVQHYRTLKQIQKDHLRPSLCQKTVTVYWGPTGVGKSHLAWEKAGIEAYPKDPRTKFWDGYQGQENVVMDEFRGDIDISHMLRWLDKYPVIVEQKFGATSFKAKNFFITSNLDPRDWYPGLDEGTKAALLRRMNIVHVPFPMYTPDKDVSELFDQLDSEFPPLFENFE